MDKIIDRIIVWAIPLGFITGLCGFWFQPYNQMEVLGINIYVITAVLSAVSAIIVVYVVEDSPPFKTALLIVAGGLIAMTCRIVFDVISDPTSHNLLPFEYILYAFINFPVTFVVAFAFNKLFYKNNSTSG